MEDIFNNIQHLLQSISKGIDDYNGESISEIVENGVKRHDEIVSNLTEASACLDEYKSLYRETIEKVSLLAGKLTNLLNQSVEDGEIDHLETIISTDVVILNEEEIKAIKNRIEQKKLKIYAALRQNTQNMLELQRVIEQLNEKFEKLEIESEQTLETVNKVKDLYSLALDERRIQEERKREMKEKQETVEETETDKENIEKTTEISSTKDQSDSDTEKFLEERKIEVEKRVESHKKKRKEKYDYEEIRRRKEDEEREAQERLANMDNWNTFKYPMNNGVFSDIDLGCIIYAFKGTVDSKDDLSVTIRNDNQFLNQLHPSTEVLSNALLIEPAGFNAEFKPQIPLKVSIPFQTIRIPSRAVVIECRDETNDTWLELDTQEAISEDMKESGMRLAEASLPSAYCTCVVVSKRRVEKFKNDKKGSRIVSSVDPRVIITIPSNAVKFSIPIYLSVQPIDSSTLSDLKGKNSSAAINNIQGISPIIEIKSDYSRNLLKDVTLQIPVPNSTGYMKKKRTFSARPPADEKVDKRAKSAFTRQLSDECDSVIEIGMCSDKENVWKVCKGGIPYQINKNGDLIDLELKNVENQKFVVYRSSEKFLDDQLQKSMKIIDESFETRTVQFTVRQNMRDPCRMILMAVPPNRMDKIQKYLTDQEFSEDTASTSQEFIVKERYIFNLTFKGNIKNCNDEDLSFLYNSQLSNKVEFMIKEIDKYAQKYKDSYQGAIVVSANVNDKLTKLWETVISLPKEIMEGNKSISRDFNFKPTDVISKEYLTYLSSQIEDDWIKLAGFLRMPEESVKRIANDPNTAKQSQAYECLLKWIKNVTVNSDKTSLLQKAFHKLGRYDLLEDLNKRLN